MQFGVFYEHQLPRPWADGDEERLLMDSLEQIEVAERAGFATVWEVEHHFLEEYSHSSAPEVFLAAVSQRTKSIRLGHGIVQLPNQFNHPARVAERIATLDLISGGRVEFGTGESSSQAELGGFGVRRDEKRLQWEENLDAVTRMMVEDPFAGYQGKFLQMPPRNVVPKPKQKPHPPLWVACSRRDTILLAARKGMGALSFSFIEPEESREWAQDYYRILESEECIPAGFSVNPNIAVALPMMCHDDESTAIERGIDGAHFFGYALAHYYVFGQHRPGHTNIWDEFHARRKDYGFAREIVKASQAPLGVKLLEHGLGSLRGAIGNPAQVSDLVARYEAAGIDQVIFLLQAGRNRHEHICESLELIGKQVLPRFAEQAESKAKSKSERYAEACGRALTRRKAAREARKDYVITSQGEPFSFSNSRPPSNGVVRFLESRSDAQLDRMLSYNFICKLLFDGMRKRLHPERDPKFSGEVQYEIATNGNKQSWVLEIRNGQVMVREGRASQPVLLIRAPANIFVRVLTGQVNAGAAAMEGKLYLEGDLNVLNHLERMAH